MAILTTRFPLSMYWLQRRYFFCRVPSVVVSEWPSYSIGIGPTLFQRTQYSMLLYHNMFSNMLIALPLPRAATIECQKYQVCCALAGMSYTYLVPYSMPDQSSKTYILFMKLCNNSLSPFPSNPLPITHLRPNQPPLLSIPLSLHHSFFCAPYSVFFLTHPAIFDPPHTHTPVSCWIGFKDNRKF